MYVYLSTCADVNEYALHLHKYSAIFAQYFNEFM